jgi:hypothetical protein
VELDLHAVHGFRRNCAVFREQTQGGVILPLLVEHLQALAPSRLLAVVDLAQIQHPPLHHPPGLQPTALLDAEITMLLAVLLPPVTS